VKDQAWFVIMTTEGGITLRELLEMEDKERIYWYEKCRTHQEQTEAKIDSAKRRH
jgi:hypothetical protein